MSDFQIRLAEISDIPQLSRLRETLWTESSAEEHAGELAQIIAGKIPAILPMMIFVAAAPESALLRFLEVGLRSHADGCDWSHAVGYVEGWFVWKTPVAGVSVPLCCARPKIGRAQGCKEIASDTQINNGVSQSAHRALGFEIAERAVLFRKSL